MKLDFHRGFCLHLHALTKFLLYCNCHLIARFVYLHKIFAVALDSLLQLFLEEFSLYFNGF